MRYFLRYYRMNVKIHRSSTRLRVSSRTMVQWKCSVFFLHSQLVNYTGLWHDVYLLRKNWREIFASWWTKSHPISWRGGFLLDQLQIRFQEHIPRMFHRKKHWKWMFQTWGKNEFSVILGDSPRNFRENTIRRSSVVPRRPEKVTFVKVYPCTWLVIWCKIRRKVHLRVRLKNFSL